MSQIYSLRRLGWLFIASAVVLALFGAWYWLASEEYTVSVDGQIHTVKGHYKQVSDVISAAGVVVDPQDRILPALAEKAESAAPIEIIRAKAVALETDDGSRVLWTHHTELKPLLEDAGIKIGRSWQITADGKELSFDDLGSAPIPDQLAVSRYRSVTIVDDDNTLPLRTDAETVSEVLIEAGVTLLSADIVSPGIDALLTPDMTIQVTRASPVIVAADGRSISHATHLTRTSDIIAEAGVVLGALDYSVPGPDFEAMPGNVIRVIRVNEDFRFEDEPISYETVWQGTDQLDLDQRAVLVAGEPGILRRRIRIRFEDGLEVSQSPDGEWVERGSVAEVIGYGTRIVVRILETPEGSYEYWRVVRMRVTAYTAATSGKPPDHPAYGITASGVAAGKGVVAIDPSVVPFRSWVFVPGYGVGYAGDTGGGVKGRWIDLGYDEDALVAWSSYVDVYYLTPVPAAEEIAYLIPTELP